VGSVWRRRLWGATLELTLTAECSISTAQETLTRHKPMVAEYLEQNYDRVSLPAWVLTFGPLAAMPPCAPLTRCGLRSPPWPLQFFGAVALLVQSSNYVTKRQSLKLLGEILLDRSNFKVMTRYIADEDNLKMMMNLLKDKSKNIQFEAFHVFKVSRMWDDCWITWGADLWFGVI